MWDAWDYTVGVSGLSRKALFQAGPPKGDNVDLAGIVGYWTLIILSDGTNPLFPRGYSYTFVFQMYARDPHKNEVFSADGKNILCDPAMRLTNLQVQEQNGRFFKVLTMELRQTRGFIHIPLMFEQAKKRIGVLPIITP